MKPVLLLLAVALAGCATSNGQRRATTPPDNPGDARADEGAATASAPEPASDSEAALPPDGDTEDGFLGSTLQAVPPGPVRDEAKALLDLLESSERLYSFEVRPVSPERAGELMEKTWPAKAAPRKVPRLIDEDGVIAVEEEVANDVAQELMDEAEVHYKAKRYAEAVHGYQRALEADPDHYLAELYTGDAYLFGGDPESALDHYLRARKLNPADHRSHYFAANALFLMGRREEAIDEYVRALTLRPRHEALLSAMANRTGRFGFTVRPVGFLPRAGAWERADGSIVIETAPELHWVLYGACKARWLGEPDYRDAQSGQEIATIHPRAEADCLELLVKSHHATRSDDHATHDLMVERIHSIGSDGLGLGMILYELGTRVFPHLIPGLPPELQADVERYVRGYLLIPVSPER